jgi:phosphatidylglycerophosphate synthase
MTDVRHATDGFAGDKKAGRWLLRDLEAKLVRACAPKVPHGIETYHLTLLTLAWTAGALAIAWLARADRRWLWGLSLLVALQYTSDVLDGAVGRLRATGLVKWGYYVDHLVDFLFMGAVFFCWAMILPGPARMLVFAVFALCGAFTTNAHLTFAVTNEFHISHFNLGATELRIAFVLVNTLTVLWGAPFLQALLAVAIPVQLLTLSVAAYRTQRVVWRMDMQVKRTAAGPEAVPAPPTRTTAALRTSIPALAASRD